VENFWFTTGDPVDCERAAIGGKVERGGTSGRGEALVVEGADLENWRVRRLLIEVRTCVCTFSECDGLDIMLVCDLATFALVLLRLRMSVRSDTVFPWLADEAEA